MLWGPPPQEPRCLKVGGLTWHSVSCIRSSFEVEGTDWWTNSKVFFVQEICALASVMSLFPQISLHL